MGPTTSTATTSTYSSERLPSLIWSISSPINPAIPTASCFTATTYNSASYYSNKASKGHTPHYGRHAARVCQGTLNIIGPHNSTNLHTNLWGYHRSNSNGVDGFHRNRKGHYGSDENPLSSADHRLISSPSPSSTQTLSYGTGDATPVLTHP